MYEGISLTELRKRREEAAKRMVDPAMQAFRKAFAEALAAQGKRPVNYRRKASFLWAFRPEQSTLKRSFREAENER